MAGAVAVAVAAAILPAAAIVLAAGLLVAGSPCRPPPLRSAGGPGPSRPPHAVSSPPSSSRRCAAPGARRLRTRGRAARAGFATPIARLVRRARRAAFADGRGDGLRLLVTGATVAAVLAVAVSAHAAGSLDRVLIATLALLALASFEAVQPLAQAARELRETLAAGQRLLELDRPATRDRRIPASPRRASGRAFRRCPRGGPRPLRRLASLRCSTALDLRLEPGRRIALVGPSGAGKTTVANLLVRFLDPECGRVTLAGRDLRDYRQEDVRRAISVAGQDSHLFSTTIRDNVASAGQTRSDGEVEDALRRARILDWVQSLPDGWDTLVGEEGRELSGGQRQRLVVARALLADAPVLVLDEPTAHLDPETAAELIDDVLDANRTRTTLLITHRPEGLERMDEVLSLESGVLA